MLYKKQLDIFNNIINNLDKNHRIINSNGVGASFLLRDLALYIGSNIDKKVLLGAPCKSMLSVFEGLKYEKITTDSDIENMDFSGYICIFSDYCPDKTFCKIIKSGATIILNQTSVSSIDNYNEYFMYHFINAFDTPNFKNISLSDIMNDTYEDKVDKDNFYYRYLIRPEEARKIFVNNGKSINSFEFKTRILGIL